MRQLTQRNDILTMDLGPLREYRSGWPWETFKGSARCIKWAFRDLQNLDRALQLTPGRDVAVQAGGNLGLFPKRLAEEFKNVYTFEPDPELFDFMTHNAPETNITAFNAAVGDTHRPVSVKTSRRDPSGRPVHEGLTHISGEGPIPQLMIDDLKLNACDIIYLDIEGYELRALRGAARTIERFRPVIGVEINRNIEFYDATADELREWITSRGYKLAFTAHSDEVYVPC